MTILPILISFGPIIIVRFVSNCIVLKSKNLVLGNDNIDILIYIMKLFQILSNIYLIIHDILLIVLIVILQLGTTTFS